MGSLSEEVALERALRDAHDTSLRAEAWAQVVRVATRHFARKYEPVIEAYRALAQEGDTHDDTGTDD